MLIGAFDGKEVEVLIREMGQYLSKPIEFKKRRKGKRITARETLQGIAEQDYYY